ncbi:hypothetical protein [Diplocloster modestus]|uniref:Uncharacterized protein n=1 Tax=Diplocloster modestus TaxID=2850322 RepID=A0ABS6KBX5_9FIRM|nr:hypothetical protein [Diplocloster modestus]MBU9728017.1 hypothetical protein [Diplocloster modestus]
MSSGWGPGVMDGPGPAEGQREVQGHDSAGMAAVVRRPHGGCTRLPAENWTGARLWACAGSC